MDKFMINYTNGWDNGKVYDEDKLGNWMGQWKSLWWTRQMDGTMEKFMKKINQATGREFLSSDCSIYTQGFY